MIVQDVPSIIFLTLFVNVCSQMLGYRPPSILYPERTNTMYFKETSNVNLTCRAEGQPQPTYAWRKNGNLVVPNSKIRVDLITGVLNILGFTRQDEGEYMCVASSQFEEKQCPPIKASGFAPPITLHQERVEKFKHYTPVKKIVSELSYAKLSCDNKGETAGTSILYNWYNSKSQTTITNEDRCFKDRNGNLHISYVLMADARDTYSCGILNVALKLTVLGSETFLEVNAVNGRSPRPPQMRYNNSGVQVIRFQDAQLECFFSGFDPVSPHFPTIRWYGSDGNNISNRTKYIVSNFGRVLIIKGVQEDDEGYYYCQAETSTATSERVQVFLDVTSAPIFTREMPKDKTVLENSDVAFQCDTRSAVSETPPELPVWYINGLKTGLHTDRAKFQLSEDMKTLHVMKVKRPHDILCIQCEVKNHVGTTWGNTCLNIILPVVVVKRPAHRQEIRHGDIIDLTVAATTDPSLLLSYRWEFKDKTYMRLEQPPFMISDPDTHTAFINTSSLTLEQYITVGGVYKRVISNFYDTEIVTIDVVLQDIQHTSDQIHSLELPEHISSMHVYLIGGLIIVILITNIITLIFIAITCCKKNKQAESQYHNIWQDDNVAASRANLINRTGASSPLYENTSRRLLECAPASPDQIQEVFYENCGAATRLGLGIVNIERVTSNRVVLTAQKNRLYRARH